MSPAVDSHRMAERPRRLTVIAWGAWAVALVVVVLFVIWGRLVAPVLAPVFARDSARGLAAVYSGLGPAGQSAVIARLDPSIDFDWGDGSPDPALAGDSFGVVWAGQLRVPQTGRYSFRIQGDDGARLFIDGALVVDRWAIDAPGSASGEVQLAQGAVDLRVEYYEKDGLASIQVSWSSQAFAETVIDPGALRPHIGP